MSLEPQTVSAMTALVVVVCALIFIGGAMVRRDDSTGAIWSLAYVGAIITTLAYAVWAAYPASGWLVSVGNGAFVAGTGCLWLGARRFNGRRMWWGVLLVVAATVVTAVAPALTPPRADGWQGALAMFVSLIVLAAAGSAECLRGDLLARRPAWGFAFVLGLLALYYVSRTTALLVVGPDSALFISWFGTVTTSLITVVLIIVATVATSVLLAERAPERAQPVVEEGDLDIVSGPRFEAALRVLGRRAAWRRELVAVVSVRIEDLEQIATAFGGDTAQDVVQTWRAAVRRYAPAQAVVGTDGEAGMLFATVADSPVDARRRASVVYRGVFDELGGVSGGVIPVLGVGVGLSATAGYEPGALIQTARDAARRAASSVESSVLIADA